MSTSAPGPGARVARSLRAGLPALVTVLAVLALWIGVTAGGAVPDYVIPPPGAVLETLAATWPTQLARATMITGTETVLGLVIGVVVALAMVVLAGYVPLVGQAMTPLLVASQAIPVVVIGPLLTIALGYGMAPKVIVVALLCFFPVALNLMAGIRAVDTRLVDTMCSLHASRQALFWRVRLPHAAPRGFAGLRVSVTFAPVAAVFAEYTGSSDGIGYLMLQSIPRLQTSFVFAQVVVLALMASILLAAVTLLERLVCSWKTPS